MAVRGDNEAARHDLLVRPILTDPLVLGWDPGEALPQFESRVSNDVIDSYYWRSASPRKRRPDIVLVPYRIGTVVGVVEEKERQESVANLEAHIGQLFEYQYLHRCVWGLLTDGEKWVVTRNHEIFHRFDDLEDLRRHIRDLQECVGRHAMIARFRKYGVWDIVYIRPSPSIIIVGSSGADTAIHTLAQFLESPSQEGRDLIMHLYLSTRKAAMDELHTLPDTYLRTAALTLFGSAFYDQLGGALILADIALSSPGNALIATMYPGAVARCVALYPIFRAYCDELLSGIAPTPGSVACLADEANYVWYLSRAPSTFLQEALREHRVLANEPLRIKLERLLVTAAR